MKKLVIKYQPNCFHLLNEALKCIDEFKNDYLNERKTGAFNGVLWGGNDKKNKRGYEIYVYHTKTQIVCDIRFCMCFL